MHNHALRRGAGTLPEPRWARSMAECEADSAGKSDLQRENHLAEEVAGDHGLEPGSGLS